MLFYLYCLIFLFFGNLFLPSIVQASEIRDHAIEKIEIRKLEPETKKAVMLTVDRSTMTAEGKPDRGLLARLIGTITVNTPLGVLVPFPIADSNKDMGLSAGIMPLLALNKNEAGDIKSVIIPSVTWNKYLGGTYTYRHFVFPDDKQFFILRASKSDHVEEELMAYYYTPDLFSTGIRFSWEPKHWISGKPSFYGYTLMDSKKNDRANYALNSSGEEMIIDFPLYKPFYINLTHSFFRNKIEHGPVNAGEFQKLYPLVYDAASKASAFHLNRFALVYDDTDHLYLPTIGTYATASVTYSNKKLGSDYEYRTYAFQMKNYYNYKGEGRFITAINALLQFQRGDILPFYAMVKLGESTGLRSVGDGRYIGRGKIIFSIEERIRLSRARLLNFINEVEIAPFVDFGEVFDKTSDFRGRDLEFSPGFSLRLVIRPQFVAAADFAFGREGANAVVKLGYPF